MKKLLIIMLLSTSIHNALSAASPAPAVQAQKIAAGVDKLLETKDQYWDLGRPSDTSLIEMLQQAKGSASAGDAENAKKILKNAAELAGRNSLIMTINDSDREKLNINKKSTGDFTLHRLIEQVLEGSANPFADYGLPKHSFGSR